ncbi:MAG: alpha/beta hydrolase [Sulfurimonas sp.]|nr:alpha/beta hydrolase [Sulfurimonas sp.]
MKYFIKQIFYFPLLSILFFTACTHLPTLQERKTKALSISHGKDIVQANIQTSSFELFSIQKLRQCKNKDIKVYIEGDGLAWLTRKRVSDDPTPLNPIALSLMNIDPSPCKVYIARPCQYIKQGICKKKYWTSHRFSSKIIQSFNEALDNLKQNHKNTSFTLVGYSGGGAVASLLSAKRNDISILITIAGNLDTDKWVELHNITYLYGSLNPANYVNKTNMIPQYHLIGTNDSVIPKDIFLSYKDKSKNTQNINHIYYDTSHTENWTKYYKNFLEEFH